MCFLLIKSLETKRVLGEKKPIIRTALFLFSSLVIVSRKCGYELVIHALMNVSSGIIKTNIIHAQRYTLMLVAVYGKNYIIRSLDKRSGPDHTSLM